MAGSHSVVASGVAAVETVAAGVVGGDRFRLETGRSGRRHVFTRLDGSIEAADLAGAVVTVCAGGHRVWAGPGEWLRLDRVPHGAEVLVHWLAETPTARARLLADLDVEAASTVAEVATVGSVRVGAAMAA